MNTIGCLIVIEGPDGVGKSELATRFFNFIKSSGQPVELMTFPGKEPGTLGKLVYELHHNSEKFDVSSLSPASMQLLHIAAHVDAIERKIIPSLKTGVHIIMDRFWWSTLVYGLANGANRPMLEQMIGVERLAWGPIKPDLLFLIDRSQPLRAEPADFWRNCQRYYSELLSTERTHHPCYMIENEGAIEQTEKVMQDTWEVSRRSHD